MGTCSGKKTLVSHSANVKVEFKPGKSGHSEVNRAIQGNKVRPAPAQKATQSSRPDGQHKVKEVKAVKEKHRSRSQESGYQHPDILSDQSEIRADIQNTDDDIAEEETIQMVRELNKRNSVFDRKTTRTKEVTAKVKTHHSTTFTSTSDTMRTLPDTELIEQTIDEVYEHVINSNLLQEKENELLEVIQEDDEIELENDNISLVESEILDEITSHIEDQIKDTSDSGKADKSKSASGKSGKSLIRSESKDSVKSEKRKKQDKNKDNHKEKLWTSRGAAIKWKQEKVYTTLGKDGTLFKIRILRKPTKDDDKGANKGKSIYNCHDIL